MICNSKFRKYLTGTPEEMPYDYKNTTKNI